MMKIDFVFDRLAMLEEATIDLEAFCPSSNTESLIPRRSRPDSSLV